MKNETSFLLKAEGRTGEHSPAWCDLPPAQAGLAAALRRAFDVPADEAGRDFDELLRQIN